MKKIIVILIFSILIIQTVSALTIDIDIPQSFSEGQQIYFNYIITSDKNEQITFMPHVTCPNAPVALLQEKKIDLTTNVPYNDIYQDMFVDSSFEPQTCTAYIKIISPESKTEQKTFTITTNPSFSFNILTCKDQGCSKKSKVFVRNSDIYLDYSSEVSNPTVTATLTYPDKTIRQITLPTSIKAEQTGTYTLDITASKEGYKTITKKEQFAVIEKGADISSGSVCNANGICDTGENYRNCPQDCLQQRAEYSGCNFNGICDDGEDAENCPWDCLVQKVKTVCIVNGICEQGEDYQNCPQDCLAAEAGKEKYDPILTFVINTLFSIILLLIVITIFIIGLKRLFKTKEENGA